MFKFFTSFIKNSSFFLMSLVYTGLIVFGGFYFYMLVQLPDVRQLRDKSMQIPLRIYANDGKLISEFGEKKRLPITLNRVPNLMIQAIIDTEDQRFFEHRGVDFFGLLRAGIVFLTSGKRSQGASTITMQVARVFFLNRQKTFGRKFNEILLAFKIDKTFNKKEILELYLNKIYFGNRAYGVAAAAQIYYGKPLDKLTLAEIAMIAGLPQAPSRVNPIANPKTARERRNHVLLRMLESGHIKQAEYKMAITSPIVTNYHESKVEIPAPYAAEIIRNMMVNKYGDAAYERGIKVYTTIDSHLQSIANQTLHDGILAYDQRHDYRGPEGHLSTTNRASWCHKLQNIPVISDLLPAAVIRANNKVITALLANGDTVTINNNDFMWAHPNLIAGDIIRVYKKTNNQWRFAQLPKIEGALVALNPQNGAILALNGGFSFTLSNYNRATQAERQTGSAFKPFIYSAALAKGHTLSTIINDAPIVLEDPSTKTLWRPQNDSQRFYGLTRLRTALIKSRNLVSIRLLQNIGIPYTINYLKNFGFTGRREIPPALSLALGTGVTTPLKMTVGYAVFANGGYKVTPFIINTIIETNNQGNKIVFQANPATVSKTDLKLPEAPQVITPQNAYLITDVLKDVVEYSNRRKSIVLNRDDLAGKTGTTNEQMDAWFSGFNGNLVTTIWLGFDQPRSTYEHAVKSVMPMWIQFMGNALKDLPLNNMQRPEDITTVRIDPTTGLLANPEQKDAIFELFTTGTVPTTVAPQPHLAIDNATESDGETPISLF